MKMTKEQMDLVGQRISELWKGAKMCSFCGKDEWSLQDKLFSLPEFGTIAEEARQVYPVVVLYCRHCGNSFFLSAISVGFSFSSASSPPKH